MNCWIFSIYNEANSPYFWSNLEYLNSRGERYLIVDGGSTDGTIEMLERSCRKFIIVKNSTRGKRFNEALKYVNSEIIVFVHPRSLIPDQAIYQLSLLRSHQQWGAFTHSFDLKHPVLEFTSWWSNFVRGDLKGIYYLDHILWVRKNILDQIGGFPEVAIFEDTIFCQKLVSIHQPTRLSSTVLTSSLRFQHNGIFKQSVLNQISKMKFYLGYKLDSIDEIYEKGMFLNSSNGVK